MAEPTFDSLLKDLALNHQRQQEQIEALQRENSTLRTLIGRCALGAPGQELAEDLPDEEARRRERSGARTDLWSKRCLALSLLHCLPVGGGGGGAHCFGAGAGAVGSGAAAAPRAAAVPPLPGRGSVAESSGFRPVVAAGRHPSVGSSLVQAGTLSKAGSLSRLPSDVESKRTSTHTAHPADNTLESYCGAWVDPQKDFLGGSVIQISLEGWKPLDPPDDCRGSRYLILPAETVGWELAEIRSDNSQRRFTLERQEEDKLCLQSEDERWVLERTIVSTGGTSQNGLRVVPPLWPEWEMAGEGHEYFVRSQSSDFETENMLAILDSQLSVVKRDTMTGQAVLLHPEWWWDLLSMKPASFRRVVWDFLSCCMVCFDVFTVPLMVFDKDLFSSGVSTTQAHAKDDVIYIMGWITTIFWTLDVPMTLLTGFHSSGVIEMRPSKIFKQYLRTWAAFDIGILLPDWFFLLFPTAQIVGILRVTKGVRFFRIFRAIRLLRFVRLQRVLHDVVDMINSETLRAFFQVMLALGFIITINHYVACGWYFLGRLAIHRGEPNWIEETMVDSRAGSEEVYGYMTSFHWSLTQFTPASMEVHPRNVKERAYSVFVLLFAMVTFSSFLASITTAITALRHFATESSKQQHELRRYFTEHRVPNELGNRIWSFLKKNHFKQQRLHTCDIAALKSLTGVLKQELCTALYLPYITRLPTFGALLTICGPVLASICEVVLERSIMREEEVFCKGKLAEEFVVLLSGSMSYHHSDIRFRCTLEKTGSWVCEQVLWLQWRHCGKLVAMNFCEAIAVEASDFRARIAKCMSPRAMLFTQFYARRFADGLKAMGDLWFTDVLMDENMLRSMADEASKDVEELCCGKRGWNFVPQPSQRLTGGVSDGDLAIGTAAQENTRSSFDLNFD